MYGLAPPARSNTLSLVLAMPQVSFRWFANGFVPGINPRKQAVLGLSFLVLAGCGSGGGGTAERLVHGRGYAFSAPLGWPLLRSGREVRLTKGIAVLSVARFPLLRAYRPALWGRARRYEVVYEREGRHLVERLGFVLLGKTEYLLLCRYESGGDTDPCDRLLATFRLG